jgi:hypothetical protein
MVSVWARHLELTGPAADCRVHDERGGHGMQGGDEANCTLGAHRCPGLLHRPSLGCGVRAARWGCGRKLGLLEGSSCIHTKSAFARSSSISSWANGSLRPSTCWATQRRMLSRVGIESTRDALTCRVAMCVRSRSTRGTNAPGRRTLSCRALSHSRRAGHTRTNDAAAPKLALRRHHLNLPTGDRPPKRMPMPGRPPGGQASACKAPHYKHHQFLKPRPHSQKTAFLDSHSQMHDIKLGQT